MVSESDLSEEEKLEEALEEKLEEVFDDIESRDCLLVELPAEHYFPGIVQTMRSLIDDGLVGAYISFQRPAVHMRHALDHAGVDMNRIALIDATPDLLLEERPEQPHTTQVDPGVSAEVLIKKVAAALQELPDAPRFVFIDSINTLSLHRTGPEAVAFAETVVTELRGAELGKLVIAFSTAEALADSDIVESVRRACETPSTELFDVEVDAE